ncbi:MAG TPA: hypothetical protein VHF58_07285, partial [Solirubrobacterales bacterium]|nr:hypothetical protein [Solirubrobacterales bacterium]
SGRGGDDVICLRGGADVTRGGPGDDIVVGGGAEDPIAGGGAADHLRGNRGGDQLAGNKGSDRINGGSGGDDCSGGGGRDRLRRCETLHGVTIGFPEEPGEAAPTPPATPPAEVNDAPSVVTTPTPRCYGNGCGPDLFIDDGVTVTDPDSTELSGATVWISAGFTPAEDELAFTDSGSISGTYDDASGTLTLTGIASVADYQTALRSVEYHRSGSASGQRTVSFQVTDAEGASSNVATRQFSRIVDP